MRDDLQAIKNLIYSYIELFDKGEFDSAVELFAAASVTVDGSNYEFRGRSIRSLLTDLVLLYDGIPHTKHLVTNVTIDLDPNGLAASARSYYVALQARPDFPLQPILAGRWHDRLSKVDGRWGLVSRVIYHDLTGDISHHLAATEV